MSQNKIRNQEMSVAIFSRAEEAHNVLNMLLGLSPLHAGEIAEQRKRVEENVDTAHALMHESRFIEMFDLIEEDMREIEVLLRRIKGYDFCDLTPGLLVSMAIRYDYTFLVPALVLTEQPEDEALEDRQIRLLSEVFGYWLDRQDIVGMEVSTAEEILSAEMTGQGFYRPENENVYKTLATATAWEVAIELVDGAKYE